MPGEFGTFVQAFCKRVTLIVFDARVPVELRRHDGIKTTAYAAQADHGVPIKVVKYLQQ